MLTYKEEMNANHEICEVKVFLDGKRVGTIEKERYGWRYHPQGKRFGGECFPSLDAVKKSLETE